MDHDRGPPPAAPRRQEHGLREVLQHGAVPLHKVAGLANARLKIQTTTQFL